MKNHELVRQIDAALAAHGSWHTEVSIEVKRGGQNLSAQHLGNPATCHFGQWISDDSLDGRIRDTEAYGRVETLHVECHKMMGEITQMAQSGQKSQANALLKGRCKVLHTEIEEALMALRGQVISGKAA